jgi:hypothetical protein
MRNIPAPVWNRERRLLCAILLLAGGCTGRAEAVRPLPASHPAGRPAGYHGVVVWLGPGRRDTVELAFAADWRRGGSGIDSAWAFPAADAGGGQTVYGREEGTRMVWGLGRMQGDVGVATEFAGVVEPSGRVRGCSRLPRRAARGGAEGPRAAFVLAPRHVTRPPASEAPVQECESGAR